MTLVYKLRGPVSGKKQNRYMLNATAGVRKTGRPKVTNIRVSKALAASLVDALNQHDHDWLARAFNKILRGDKSQVRLRTHVDTSSDISIPDWTKVNTKERPIIISVPRIGIE